MRQVHDDGGREAAGYRGLTGDCVTRAIAIATETPYVVIYGLINDIGREYGRNSAARLGPPIKAVHKAMAELGWQWQPTMFIGSGTRVHLREDELPAGHLVCRLSGHTCAVIDGVIHDLSNPSRGGTRAVYGYWFNPDER